MADSKAGRHKFYSLKVAEVRAEASDCVSLRFEVPDALQDLFSYQHGQHLTVRKEIGDEDIRRNYSICQSVDDKELRVAVRKVEGGRFSCFANEALKAGDTLDIMPPTGHFNVALDPLSERRYVAFAAGSGITPILSIIKTTLEREPNARFTLFYGNRSSRSMLFGRQISELKNRFMDRFAFFNFMSQQRLEVSFFNGRLDGNKVQTLLDKMVPVQEIDHAFICGPAEMIDDVSDTLLAAGLDRSAIHVERFTTGLEAARPPRSHDTKSSEQQTDITVILDGVRHVVKGADRDTTLLDAASKAGLDVPFACKGGVCCTCRAKLVGGEADMVLNQGLESDEVDKGYILTCQSYPLSASVTLDYDA